MNLSSCMTTSDARPGSPHLGWWTISCDFVCSVCKVGIDTSLSVHHSLYHKHPIKARDFQYEMDQIEGYHIQGKRTTFVTTLAASTAAVAATTTITPTSTSNNCSTSYSSQSSRRDQGSKRLTLRDYRLFTGIYGKIDRYSNSLLRL